MQNSVITFFILWSLILIGAIANVYQVVVGFLALDRLADISGLLAIKTIAIFMGPIGSIFGFVGMF